MERKPKGTMRALARGLMAALIAVPLLMGACKKDDGPAPAPQEPTKADLLIGKWLKEYTKNISYDGTTMVEAAHPDRPEHMTFRADGKYEEVTWTQGPPGVWTKETDVDNYALSEDGKSLGLGETYAVDRLDADRLVIVYTFIIAQEGYGTGKIITEIAYIKQK